MDCKDHGKTKSLRPEGYALVGIPGVRSRCVNLHRLVYCESNGLTLDDIKGQCVRHTCDNPRCIEPTHLILGSWAQNNKDRAERGRSAKSVPSRQKLTAQDCFIIMSTHVKNHQKYGASALARRFGVDDAVIHKVLKGLYVCTRSS